MGDVSRLLSRESGASGVFSDMRALEASTLASAAMPMHHFVEDGLHQLAGMAAEVCGTDTLVFTGGFSANASRACVDASVAWLGLVDV